MSARFYIGFLYVGWFAMFVLSILSLIALWWAGVITGLVSLVLLCLFIVQCEKWYRRTYGVVSSIENREKELEIEEHDE